MTSLLFDFFPVVVFFAAFKAWGLMPATFALILATVVQVGIGWARTRAVNKMHVVTAVLVIVFGGITLLMNDEIWIKWKPTVVNWAFATVFAASHFVGDKPIIRRMLDKNVALPDSIWHRLGAAWCVFFLFTGTLNLWVAYTFSTDAWVNFKLFGLIGLTLAFALAQGFYIARHVEENA